MTLPFIDTDVIIRLLTGDDPVKQVAASVLSERIETGSLTVAAPDTVIADAVYVLASPRLYNLARAGRCCSDGLGATYPFPRAEPAQRTRSVALVWNNGWT